MVLSNSDFSVNTTVRSAKNYMPNKQESKSSNRPLLLNFPCRQWPPTSVQNSEQNGSVFSAMGHHIWRRTNCFHAQETKGKEPHLHCGLSFCESRSFYLRHLLRSGGYTRWAFWNITKTNALRLGQSGENDGQIWNQNPKGWSTTFGTAIVHIDGFIETNLAERVTTSQYGSLQETHWIKIEAIYYFMRNYLQPFTILCDWIWNCSLTSLKMAEAN